MTDLSMLDMEITPGLDRKWIEEKYLGGHSRETMMNDWNFAKHFFSLNKSLIVWFDDYNVFANKSDQRVWSCDFIVDDLDENVYDVMINDEYEEYNRFRATNARVSLKK